MANYFPHDYDAQTDPKLQALIAEYKAEGYGVYWCVIEMLHKEQSHHLPRKKYVYSALAKQMSTSVEQIEAVLNYAINECELFIEAELGFTSKRVLKNIKYMQDISEKRSKAGKKSAESRKNSTSVEQVLTGVELCSTNKIKETKIKETKEVKEYTFPETILMKISKPEKVWKEYHLQHIPVTLHNETFILNWVDWIDHLISKKKKPTENAAKRQLEKLSKVDDPNLWLNTAIEHGWQGLFPPPETKVIKPTSEPAWMK